MVEDWSEELAQIDLELKRLGWDATQEAAYLQQQYGKRSRDYITDYDELVSFLQALRSLATPLAQPIESWQPNTSNPVPNPIANPVANSNSNPRGANPSANLEVTRREMMDQVIAECKRLGWSRRQGSEYLLHAYNKLTRKELTDQELVEFLNYLKSLSPSS
jgi:virulence-associated protein VapD